MQESKYKRINTKSLFEEFKSSLENLDLTEEGLRLSRRELYKPGDNILEEPSLDLRDVAADECDTVYVIDMNSMSILTCHRDFENPRFPAYKPRALDPVVQNPEGIAVDENAVYVIGTFSVPEGTKEGLVALGKKDLKVLWTVLKGPEGDSLKDLTDLYLAAGNLYVLEKGRPRVLKLSLRERAFSEIGRDLLYKPENIYVDAGGLLHVLDGKTGYFVVDENAVYVIGTRVLEGGKKDLKVLWPVLKGPDGLPRKDLTDLYLAAGKLYVLEKGRHRILKLSLRERAFSEIGRGELSEPENIYVNAEGALHVFGGKPRYFVFRADGTVEAREITPSIQELSEPENIYVDVEGSLHVFDGKPGYFSGKPGYFVFRADGTVEAREITSFIQEIVSIGRAHDSRKNRYLISENGKSLRFLKYSEENNPDSKGIFKGTYLSKPVDSQVRKTRWYRFLLEGSFPRGTKVEFHYYISDKLLKKDELEKLPESKWEEGLPGSSAVQGEEKRDALFRTELEGRYLWFKITLMGTEKLSPAVSSVMIFFPKVSYLDYLPLVYMEDPANRDFLDRFLAIFESLFFETDFEIDHLGRYLDVAGTPPEFLEWLGGWVAASQGRGDQGDRKKVPEAKQREFISRAVPLYRERGTREGLENLIFFYTGKKPIIVENFPVDRTKENNGNENQKETEDPEQKQFLFFPPEAATSKLPARKRAAEEEVSLHDVLFGGEKFSFVVLFKEKLEEAELELVRNIIEEEKPAHISYKIKVLEPWFCLDGHTYLGENTWLKRPEFLLGKHSVLGRDTALGTENGSSVAEGTGRRIILI